MKHPGVRAPITNLTIPPLAPAAVAEAQANYDRVCDQLAELQSDLHDARDAIDVGAKVAIEQDAAALVAGAKVKSRVVAQDRETAIAKLEQQRATLEKAADIAGNDLCDAIGASKGEWTPALEQAETEAVEAFRAAIKASQDAAKALGNARRASEWLADFHAGRAKIGGSPFSGGTLKVQGRDAGAFRGEHVVTDVLALCEKAAAPVVPQTTQRVAK
jgi:hypothetical protein